MQIAQIRAEVAQVLLTHLRRFENSLELFMKSSSKVFRDLKWVLYFGQAEKSFCGP